MVRRLLCLHRACNAPWCLRACGTARAHPLAPRKLLPEHARRTATNRGLERRVGAAGASRDARHSRLHEGLPIEPHGLRSIDPEGLGQTTARLGFIRYICALEDARVCGSDARKRTSSPGRKPIQEAPTLDPRECHREVPKRCFDRRTITASNHDLGSLGDCRGPLLARRVAIFERNINPGAAGGMGSETK